jgi:hypothetical protein
VLRDLKGGRGGSDLYICAAWLQLRRETLQKTAEGGILVSSSRESVSAVLVANGNPKSLRC